MNYLQIDDLVSNFIDTFNDLAEDTKIDKEV